MKKNYGIDISILNAPWLIEPAAMDHLAAALRHLNMDEAMRIYRSQDPENDDNSEHYELRDGVAILHISGTLTPDEGFFSRLFGGSGTLRTYAAIRKAVTAADKDPAVKKKVMKINSPGGTVAGAFESAHFLRGSGTIKPLYAYADGQMTSAAQLLGAAAKQIAAPKTAQVGSVGVLWAHVNEEKLNERIGIDVTYLHAGRYKAFGSPDHALTDEAKTYFQDRLDQTYTFFIDDMAVYRNISPDDMAKAADGRVYLADQGREAGLVDVIVNDFEEFFTTLTQQEDSFMDVNELKTKHPELYAQVMDLGRNKGLEEASANAPDPEAIKKQAVVAAMSVLAAVAGKEMADKVKKITDLGLTAEQLEAARNVLVPEAPANDPANPDTGRTPHAPTRQQILESINAAGTPPLNQGGGQDTKDKVDFIAEVEAYKKENPTAHHMTAIQSVRKIHPQAYEAWIEAENKR